MFNDLINTVNEYLSLGNTDSATEALHKACKYALGVEERKLAHDLGNAIQREIFAQYEAKAA